MFLIYNFHLVESKISAYDKQRFFDCIASNLNRVLINEDFENMNAYGSEALCLASLVGHINEFSLRRNWSRMNTLYNIFLLKDEFTSDEIERENQKAYDYFSNKKYPSYSASIDKIIKICKKNNKKNKDFLNVIQYVCPFLKRSIEKIL